MSSLAAGFLQGWTAGAASMGKGLAVAESARYHGEIERHHQALEGEAKRRNDAELEKIPPRGQFREDAERNVQGRVTPLDKNSNYDNAMSLHGRLMKEYGLSPEVADGAVGSVMGESGKGLDPSAYNPDDNGSPSGGAFQHHLDRLDNLKGFAKQSDVRKIPYKVQEDFVFNQELAGDRKIVVTKLKEIQSKLDKGKLTPEDARSEAATVWTKYFENPKDANQKAKERATFAGEFTKWRMAHSEAPTTAVAKDEGQPEKPRKAVPAAPAPLMSEAPQPVEATDISAAREEPAPDRFPQEKGQRNFLASQGVGVKEREPERPEMPTIDAGPTVGTPKGPTWSPKPTQAVGGQPQPQNLSPFGWGRYLPEEEEEGFTPTSEGMAGYPTEQFTPALAMGGGVQTMPQPTFQYRAGGAVPELKQKFQFGGYSDDVEDTETPTRGAVPQEERDLARDDAEFNRIMSDLPPNARSMVATTARPAPEKEKGTGDLSEAVKGGMEFLRDTFGLQNDEGAVPQNDPAKNQRAVDMLRGVGANTPDEGIALGNKVDPNKEMTTASRNAYVLNEIYKFYRDRGDHDKAQKAAAEFIQLCNVEAQRISSLGVVAAEKGDYAGAAKAVQSAYNQMPNGQEVEIKVKNPSTGEGEMITKDATSGKETGRQRITGEDIAAQAAGLSNGTGFYKAMVEAAGSKLPQQKETSYDKRMGLIRQFNMAMEETPIDYTRKDLPKTYSEAITPEQRDIFNQLPTSRQKYENDQYLVRSGQKSVSGRGGARGAVEVNPEDFDTSMKQAETARDNVEKWRKAAEDYPEKMDEKGKAAAAQAEQEYSKAYYVAEKALGNKAKEFLGGFPKPRGLPRLGSTAVPTSQPRVVAQEAPAYTEGQTATLKDGTKVEYVGGKWRTKAPGGLMPLERGSYTSRPELMGQ